MRKPKVLAHEKLTKDLVFDSTEAVTFERNKNSKANSSTPARHCFAAGGVRRAGFTPKHTLESIFAP